MSNDAVLLVDLGGPQEFAIGDEPLLIGRSPDCRIHLQGNPNSSRKHAEIRRVGSKYVLTDLGSGNGTTINGQRIMEANLMDGDVIQIGGVDIRFRWSGAPRASGAIPPAPPPVAPAPPPIATPIALPTAAAPAPTPPPAVPAGSVGRPATGAIPRPPTNSGMPAPTAPGAVGRPNTSTIPRPPTSSGTPIPATPGAVGRPNTSTIPRPPTSSGTPVPATPGAVGRPNTSSIPRPAAIGTPRVAAPSEAPGTEALDMGNVMRRLSEETAALDKPPALVTEEPPTNPTERRNVLVLFGSIAVALIIAFIVLLRDSGPADTGPVFEPFTRIETEVDGVAYLTLEHKELRPKDPSMIRVSSQSDGRNEIAITGLKPGLTLLYVLVDPTHGFQIEVTVKEKEAWPPGWTQDDRLAAAEELGRQADGLYRSVIGHIDSAVPIYHTYRKILRLYDNCTFHPDQAYQEATERKDDLEQQIVDREKELLREYHRSLNTREFNQAEAFLDSLLALFPEDGNEATLLTQHGDTTKYRQYFLLREKLRIRRNKGR